MSENRYSVRTVAKYLSLSVSTIYKRANNLRINPKHGLSVHDVKNIMEFMVKPRAGKFRTTIEDLKKEMEETYRE